MNDFDYDAKEKKKIANNVFRMNRTKPGCRLPCDSLTEKQIQKKHGEVFSMNINKPMSWEEFKSLPKNMALEYYNSLVARFGVGSDRVAKMMGTSKNNLCNRLLTMEGVRKAKKGGGGWNKYMWEEFLEQGETVPIEEPKEEQKAEEAFVKIPKEVNCPIASYHLQFKNVQSWGQIADMLIALPLPKDAVISINVMEGI